MASYTIHNPSATWVARPSMATQVYYRFAWTDNWQWLPEAWCSEIVDAVAPSTSSATIQYQFGTLLTPGQTTAAVYAPGGLLGAYVLVEGINPYGRWPLWVGLVQHEQTQAWGNADVPTGNQQYMATGLELLLDRIELRGAYTSAGQIDRPLNFNMTQGFGTHYTPNMGVDDDGWPVFAQNGDYWNHRAVFDYIMHWYLPSTVTWELANADVVQALGYVEPKSYDGFTVRQVLDDMFDRRRGLGWCVRVDAYRNVATVCVFTELSESLTIGATTIPANPAQTDVYYDGVIDVDPVYRFSDVAHYDAVQVLGGPVYSTLSFDESVLPKVAELAQVDPEDLAAGEDVRIMRLASYAFDPDWDWYSPSGDNAAPGVNWDGDILRDVAPAVFNEARAFERQLPFYDERNEPRAPFALVYLDSKWQYSERAKNADVPQSLGLNLADETVGFTFQGADTEDGASALPAAGNWLLTATLPTDRRLAVRVVIGSPPTIERVRTLEVPEAIAHWVCNQTVVDVDSLGYLIRHQGDSVYYSDVALLRNIAALAVAWYGRRRSSLDVQISGITFEYLPGSLIMQSKSSYFSTPVETVVTTRRYDFLKQTTSVETSYDELAITRVAR